jgi:hypothetical protein
MSHFCPKLLKPIFGIVAQQWLLDAIIARQWIPTM